MKQMTRSDKRIYEFFTKLRTQRKDIPYITEVAKITGVSIATLSRYARKKGFSNFAVLRDDYNKKKNTYRKADEEMLKMISFIKESKSLYIVPSNTCISLGFHLKERLKKLGYKVELRPFEGKRKKILEDIKKNVSVIFISVSAKSGWYEEFCSMKKENEAIIISTIEPVKIMENVEAITHLDKAPAKRSDLEENISRGKLLDWIDKTVTQLQISLLKKKK